MEYELLRLQSLEEDRYMYNEYEVREWISYL